jgi:ribokinase
MIIVFGSLNIDLVLTTKEHPHPGETVLCDSTVFSPGGKGANQAVAAARAGADIALVGRIGDDAFGSIVIESLGASRIDASGVTRTPDVLTGCAVVAVDRKGENVIYVSAGANLRTCAGDLSDDLLLRATCVVCQMEVPPAENWRVLRRAKANGIRTVLNLAPARGIDEDSLAEIKQCVDVLVLNREEAAELCTHLRPDLSRSDARPISRYLSRALETLCVITLGADGACAAEGGSLWMVSSADVQVEDSTGAGDTFTGVLAATLAEGRPVGEALAFASTAASLACRGLGAQQSMPWRPEIDSRVGEVQVLGPAASGEPATR